MAAWPRAILLLPLVLLFGCSTAPTASEAPPAATTARYGAPSVARPLDVTEIFAAPCGQLSADDLAQLGIAAGGRERSYLGDSECRWNTKADESLLLSVDRDRDLLGDTYRARLFPVFQPVVVADYPAVREMTKPEDNNCIVTVGLGPKQALRADWTGLGTLEPGDPDPCERAETAAALVIRKLPPQS